jgi:hypothetical protein
MLNVYTTYPQHIKILGNIELESFSINIEELRGVYLDYALALSTLKDGVVILDFLPDGLPYQVRFGSEIMSAKLWSSSKEESQAQKIEIVRLKFGNSINLERIRKS